jgi:hypothetical protein
MAPAPTVTLEGTVATDVLLLESITGAPPAGAGPLSVTVPVDDCVPPTTLVGFKLDEERWAAEPVEDCSKTHTEGFGSLAGIAANLEGEITYTITLSPELELTVMLPRPFVGEEEMEYEALNGAPEIGPFAEPIS